MKKTIILFLSVLSAFVLIACGGQTTDSTPELHGITDATVNQGTVFNPRTGITATDDIDGNLTSVIQIEGAVNTDIVGTYMLTYRVTNSLGKSAEANRNVAVIPSDGEDIVFTYYEPTKLAQDGIIHVLNDQDTEMLDNDQLFTAQAIQGLFAREEVRFYIDGRTSTNMINTDRYHLQQTVERYDLTVEYSTLADAIAMYQDKWDEYVDAGIWGSNIPLDTYNTYPTIPAYTESYIEGELAGYDTPGYIVYREGTTSVNIAATLAGLTGFLPIELSYVDFAKDLGLVEKMNVDNIVFGYMWLFGAALSEINPDGLIHQNYSSPGGLTNPYLKDYGITEKYMHVYYDNQTNAPTSFRRSLHGFLTPNRPIFGYTYSEDQDVAFFSEYGQFIVPTDFTYNLSYLMAETFRYHPDGTPIRFEQPNTQEVTVDSSKHYVAFIVSDGDNATMWQNTSLFGANFMNAVGRENDTFPVTWSITPSLADMMPSVLYSTYYEVSNDYDYFAAPVSGHGYINAGQFNSVDDGTYFDDYLNRLNTYMRKADLGVVTVIGAESAQNQFGTLDGYASVPSVTGGVVYTGSKYFGNIRGGVYWSNGKPFVGPRDSLWETTPEFIAARLNMYEKDPTTINGYSIINVHPWSHSYEDMRTIANMLDDSVEVVSIDTLYQLMTENIIDQTNPGGGFTIPEQNGISITQSYLEANPELIPVNPLFNDFLLWTEDWNSTSGSISHAGTDSANSNVGSYLTSMVIAGNSVAQKESLNLPNIDDLWVSFVARGNSSNANDTARFKLTMTVDGETKTIIDEAHLRGVSGTGTESNINGDGWQFFAFPIHQYFTDYKNKSATFAIETLGSLGIRVDKFTITNHTITPNNTYDTYNNQFLEGNTEDWFLGYQFLTSQYAYWGALNKDNGRPFADGTIQIDVSDGGGDEKRNANSNLWMAKNYVLPENDQIYFTFDIDGNAGESFTGGKYKISLYVEGRYVVVQDWLRASDDTPATTVDVSALVPNVNLSGLEVTVVIEVRDSGINNGVGEVAFFRSFITTTEQQDD